MRGHQPDYIIISIIFALVVFGLVVLSNPSVVLSQETFKESYYFLKHQLYSIFLGIFLFLVCQKINYKYWQKTGFFLLLFSILLLTLVFVPKIGYSYGEAKRWISWGPFSFQPFELVKLTFIFYLAGLLSRRRANQNQLIKESLVPFFVFAGIISLLVICQPDFSALAFLTAIAFLIYFLAGMKISYLLAAGSLALIGLFALVKTASYRTNRLIVFLHPEMDPQGIGYQINQALLAIGSGGLFGVGLGHSIQKWQYLPEPIGDSIFAIIGEELGLIGAGILIILFILLAWRGLKIAKNASDRFGFLLASGITGWVFLQASVNIASISGLIPLTGLTLPFISYGGSAMVVLLAGMGVLVNISKYTK